MKLVFNIKLLRLYLKFKYNTVGGELNESLRISLFFQISHYKKKLFTNITRNHLNISSN